MKIKLIFLVSVFYLFFACTKDTEDEKVIESPELPIEIKYEVIKEYSFNELKTIEKSLLESVGYLISFVGNTPKYDGNTQMKVYKVMFPSKNPDGSDSEINLSGILIVPPLEKDKTYRQVVAPPYTFISRDAAPTVRIVQNKLEEHLIFWIIEAYRYGYAVMIPDYPGFGDSFGQCFIPYVVKKPITGTTIEYVKSAREVLEKEKYPQKAGLIISGYSLGAYVSLQLAHELETNSLYNSELKVDLLIVGGSPCNLLQEAELIRSSQNTTQPHLFPLALLGFKKNGYKQLVMSDYLNEPYASETETALDGFHEYEGYFPTKTSELFTSQFINNQGMAEINKILSENSVSPWKNSCKFIMTHGSDDVTVYHQQARDFATAQNASGGKVEFATTASSHTGAGIWFYLRLLLELDLIK
jgi:pimeloyl-ACP methyl ester carboxylesterase